MFCSNCGKEIPEGSRFCPNCGAQAPQAAGGQQQYGQQGQQFNQQQYGQQGQQQYNQQQYNQQGQWSGQAEKAGKSSLGGMLVKIAVVAAAIIVVGFVASMFLGGGDDGGHSGSSGNTGSTQAALPDPNSVISVNDFDWFYEPRTYDSGKDVPVTEAYSPSGVWKVTIMRKPTKKTSFRKELYLLDLTVEGRPRNIGSEEGAADVYALQGFKKSDEAKEAGLQGSDTAENLISALAEGDGTLPVTGTLLLLLEEDENGSMVQPKKETFIEVSGIYSPKRAILRLEDSKGNEYGTHGFVKSGNEEHCAGAYTASKGDPVLGGYIGMCRDIE